MNFKKLRLLRELRQKHAHQIAVNKSSMDELDDEELLDVLIALEINNQITDTVNYFLGVDSGDMTLKMLSHTLSAALGNVLDVVEKRSNKKRATAFHADILRTILRTWRKK